VLFSVQFLLIYGISLAVSSINLFIRDLERLVAIATTLLFYFTPIIYPETMMPDKYKYFLSFNPVAALMISWRNLFLKGLLNQSYLVESFLYASAAFLIGYAVYRMLGSRFAEVL
jgi:lipopolysaccharide transport system permease protein